MGIGGGANGDFCAENKQYPPLRPPRYKTAVFGSSKEAESLVAE